MGAVNEEQKALRKRWIEIQAKWLRRPQPAKPGANKQPRSDRAGS